MREYAALPPPSPHPRRTVAPPPPAPDWEGSFTRYRIGEPGAAAAVKPRPDPSEWDRRDTVLDGVYIRDDLDQDRVQLRAASVRGLAHRFAGTVRQDEYAFRRTDDGRHLVLAVADGVSSGRLSHQAAALVCRLGTKLVAASLAVKPPEELDWTAVMLQLSQEIRRIAAGLLQIAEPTHDEVVEQMAATALFGVLELRPPDGGNDLVAHVAAVGDSSAWVLRADGWEPLQAVKNSDGVVATSVTRALPLRSVKAEVTARPVIVGRGEALVLMSDGVGDPMMDGTGPVGRVLAEAWRRPPAPLDFAAQVDFLRKTHDDDRTVVAAWVE
ncbi:protein phosphatase 2C domain-containing protein [Dactylosporangium darangshiense]|uniref:protein phosphatase 2C domain-containing protein n=1 Tax=Dactylosporangium darangshiense TaxID=579108 RepID=UPI00363D0CAB